MSMLARYRKPGGFAQLLSLIETCDPLKQSKLLELVGTEDPGWAVLVKTKSLSLHKIFSWQIETLMEITPSVPDKIMATAIYKLPAEIQEKVLRAIPASKAREVRSLLSIASPSAGEQNASAIKIIQIVRDLDREGRIKLSQIDPELGLDKQLAA